MRYKFIDPGQIMGVVVALIILAVGMFAFFVTIGSIPVSVPNNGTNTPGQTALTNATYYAMKNATTTGNQVFNIVGVVLIIGAIMAIVGVVYSYIKPGGL